jgi:hypothetical protein
MNVSASSSQRIALPIVPIMARSMDGERCVCVYALLDPGATHTFCDERLASALQLPGKQETMLLSTMELQKVKVSAMMVTFKVSDMSGHNEVVLSRVATRPSVAVDKANIASSVDVDRWPHLKDIPLPRLDDGQVLMIIGQNNAEILLPREVRQGKEGEPYAYRTFWAGCSMAHSDRMTSCTLA